MVVIASTPTWQELSRSPVVIAVLSSVVAIVLALLLFYFIKRLIVRSSENPAETMRTRLLLGSIIFFGLLFVLIRAWMGLLLAHNLDLAVKLTKVLDRILWTFVVALTLGVLVTTVRRTLSRSITALEDRHRIRLATTWIGVLTFLIIAGFLWAGSMSDFSLFLGIVGAGLALSLQETLVSIAGWLLILFRRPYDIGDRIEIDGRKGDVIGISVFQTSMLEVGNWIRAEQSTGRMLIIPNSMLFRHPVYNYSKGFPFIWDELPVTITFESDWQAAEKLMLEQAEIEAEKIETQVKTQIQRMQSHYAIRYERLTPIVYTSIADSGVELVLRYLCPVRERRTLLHRISRNILSAFLKHPRIDLAYPTTRYFRNLDEGKDQLRPGGGAAGGIVEPSGE